MGRIDAVKTMSTGGDDFAGQRPHSSNVVQQQARAVDPLEIFKTTQANHGTPPARRAVRCSTGADNAVENSLLALV